MTAPVLRGGHPCVRSDRQRDPDAEEVETPLVVARVPHWLLLKTPVVDRRRRRPPCLGKRPVPRRRRRRTPTPRRRSVTPRRAVEPSAPIVVTGIPWRSPLVVSRSLIVEIARWRTARTTRTARAIRSPEVSGRTARGRTAAFVVLAWRSTGSAGPALTLWRTARSTESAARAALHAGCRIARRCVGDRRRDADAGRPQCARDRRRSDQLFELHSQALPPRPKGEGRQPS